MKNLIQPENSAEAKVLESLLNQHNIQSQVISFHDTAYDGLFQTQYGWGVIRVSETDFSRAQKIVNEWKKASPKSLDWEDKSI